MSGVYLFIYSSKNELAIPIEYKEPGHKPIGYHDWSGSYWRSQFITAKFSFSRLLMFWRRCICLVSFTWLSFNHLLSSSGADLWFSRGGIFKNFAKTLLTFFAGRPNCFFFSPQANFWNLLGKLDVSVASFCSINHASGFLPRSGFREDVPSRNWPHTETDLGFSWGEGADYLPSFFSDRPNWFSGPLVPPLELFCDLQF